MSDNVQHLMVEHFRKLGDKIDRVSEEVREVKTVLLGVKHELRAIQLNTDVLGEQNDSIRKRVDRIERRLELSGDAAGFAASPSPPYEPRPTKRG